MRLLVVTCARLFKTPDGTIYTPVAYGYEFFKRYLNVFEEIRLAGFCDNIDEESSKTMLKVSGENLSVFEVPYPHGEWDYIRKRWKIINSLLHIAKDCDAALLRVPETLSFLVMNRLIRGRVPFGVEVVSDPLKLYTRLSCPSKYRLVYKYYYYLQLLRACCLANGTSYVTEFGLQRHYPPLLSKKDHFTTYYTDASIQVESEILARTVPINRPVKIIHVAVSLGGFAKGHKETLEAFSELARNGMNVELTLVGGGNLSPTNQSIIDRENLAGKIRFTGLLSNEEVINEIKNSDLFFFPSYNEGLPRVVIEAMSQALPIVATDIPAHRELLLIEYLAPVRNSHALYEITKKLLSDPKSYTIASWRNLEKANDYDVRVVEKRRSAFYMQLRNLAEKRKQLKRLSKQDGRY